MDIGFISCVSKKKTYKAKAKELYISDLFKKSLMYSLKHYDKTYILSAKYGLLEIDDIIEPYNLTLNKFTEIQKKRWSYNVLKKIDKVINPNDIIYWHCGLNYRKYISIKLKNIQHIPLVGLGIGKQLQWYKNRLNDN